jgi:hypothetical protein
MPQRHRSELSESVSGEHLVTYKRLPRQYRSGRTCAVPGCPTVLSIYNSGKQCAAHNPIRFRAAPVPATREATAPAEATVPPKVRARRQVTAPAAAAVRSEGGSRAGVRTRARVLVDPGGEIRRRAS